MPLFQYRADLGNGQTMQGPIEALDEADARRQLASRGMNQVTLTARSQPSASPPVPPAPAVRPASVPAPGPIQMNVPQGPGRPASVSPSKGGTQFVAAPPQVQGAPGQAFSQQRPVMNTMGSQAGGQGAAGQIHETKRGSNKVLGFLFRQLASYFHTGVNPAQAFSQLATQTSQAQYRESLMEAARLTAEGLPFSRVMEMYPDLYPQSVCGIIRAGEEGGFMAEACAEASKLAIQARKMNIWGGVSYFNLMANILLFWPVWLLSSAIVKSWNIANAHPENSGISDLTQGITHYLLWPFTPIILATIAATWLIPKWWMRRSNTVKRHQLASRFWPLNRRAKAEAMQVFSWVLAKTSHAGMSPLRCYQLAAKAVPNRWFSDQLLSVQSASDERTGLTALLLRSGIASAEMTSLAQTGEMTGQTSELMMQAAQMEQQTFSQQNTLAGVELGCLIILVGIVATGIAMIVFALGYSSILNGLMK